MKNLVPTFSLYGEEHTAVAREYVHIEEISARSAARNWQIDTHTHAGLLQILFVFSGTARIMLDGYEGDYPSPLAVVIPPGVIHGFKFMPDSVGYVLTLDASGLASQSEDGTQMFAVLRGGADVITLQTMPSLLDEEKAGSPLEEDAQRIKGLLQQIEAEYRSPGPASVRLLVWLVRALLLLVVRARLRSETLAEEKGAGVAIAFQNLLEKHYQEHWPIERYAQELNTTSSRLNRLCQKRFDRSAFTLIQERLLLEARRKLIYTSMPVSQLAYELGFSDPAYFCRFFKRLTGRAPSTFRSDTEAN